MITNEEGSNHNGRVRCRFTVDREIDYYYPQLTHIGGQHYHLLLARGEAIRGRSCLLQARDKLKIARLIKELS